MLDFEVTKETPYGILTGELRGVHFENFIDK